MATRDDISYSGSDFVEEFCMIAGSHTSTLDRLYAWERKLYDEVKVLCQLLFDYRSGDMFLSPHDINVNIFSTPLILHFNLMLCTVYEGMA